MQAVYTPSSSQIFPVAPAPQEAIRRNPLDMPFNDLTKAQKSTLMRNAGKVALARSGFALEKVPGMRGNRQVMRATRGEECLTVAVRTSQDGWLGYPTNGQPSFGKSLAGLDSVVVVVPDNVDAPQMLEVYMVDPHEMELRFKTNFEAHFALNRIPKHPVMWLSLRHIERAGPSSAGAGILATSKKIGEFSIEDSTIRQGVDALDGEAEDDDNTAMAATGATAQAVVDKAPTTIPEAIHQAKVHIARISGMPIEVIKLELKFADM